jgi:hypothetical protein
MKTKWNSSNYGNDLKLTSQDAKNCSHQGQCDNDVKAAMLKPYVKKQLAKLNPIQLKKELHEYGAWSEEELNNHEDNLMRWLWISAGDISEGR